MHRRIGFHPESRSLENVLVLIADANRIAKFRFVVYRPLEVNSYTNVDSIDVHKFERKFELEPGDLSRGLQLSQLKQNLEEAIGISSETVLDTGQLAHMQHLDVDLNCSLNISSPAESIFPILRQVLSSQYGESFNGFVVFSGRGYHYYGTRVMDDEQWRQWIEKTKRTQYIEPNWAEIQLKRGLSILRVTSGGLKISEPQVFYKVAGFGGKG